MKDVNKNLKYIHECAKEKSVEILSRKQHLEIKILYLLQAVAILGGISAFNKPDESCNYWVNILEKYSTMLSYISLGLAVIILMIGLNDNVLNNRFIKHLLPKTLIASLGIFAKNECEEKYSGNSEKYIKEKVKKYIFCYKETPFPDIELNEYEKYSRNAENEIYANIDNYYKFVIETIGKSTRTGNYVTIAKNRCFTIGLASFIIAVIFRLVCSCLVYTV